MFNLFSSKPNYEAIFASQEATRKLIYADRASTSKVLGDQAFNKAWLASRHQPQITALIRSEALKGDVPSIKQMIWLGDLYFRDAARITDSEKRTAIQKSALKERIMFCEKAISLGMKDKSYPAMISSANLYSLLESSGSSVTDELIRSTLIGIIRNARLFLETDSGDPGLIEDANNALEQFEPLAKVMSAFNRSASHAAPPNVAADLSSLEGIGDLIEQLGISRAREVLREAALGGNLLCQIFFINLLIPALDNQPSDQVKQEFELFAKLAAEQGDPESQFNLGLHYASGVDVSDGYLREDDRKLLEQARHWHEKAAAQGFNPSIDILRDLEGILS